MFPLLLALPSPLKRVMRPPVFPLLAPAVIKTLPPIPAVVELPTPAVISTLPPVDDAAEERPAEIVTLPPEPVSPDPTVNVISPPLPQVASPVVNTNSPVFPDAAVPVETDTAPETPAVPAAGVEIVIAPLLVAVPDPDSMVTAPPVVAEV
jgi:hypothetical protein